MMMCWENVWGQILKKAKITLPFIHALKAASEEEKLSVAGILHKRTISQKDFEWVSKLIKKYNGIGYTSAATEKHLENAKKHLDHFPASQYKNALLSLADSMLKREK